MAKKQETKMDKPEPTDTTYVPNQIGNGGKETQGIQQAWGDYWSIEDNRPKK